MTPEPSNPASPAVEPIATMPPGSVDRIRPDRFGRWLALGFLAVCILIATGVRLRLLDFPLERDEGEYAYAGQLIREGVPPYQLVYNMKMPGIYLAYAGLMTVFGETTAGVHLGLLTVNLATLAALFLVARRLLDLPGAVIATAAYALMILSPAYLGLAAHATHFVNLAALWGIWLLLRVEENGRAGECLLAGCLFGTAFLMKQPGLFLGLFGGLWLAGSSLAGKTAWSRTILRLAVFVLGCLLPFLVVCLWLKIAGVFPAFWFWTITYAREYVAQVSFHQGLRTAKSALTAIIKAAPLLWGLAGLGLAGLGLKLAAGRIRLFLGGLLGFSALAVAPGFYFRAHYFIVLAPAVALLAGLAVACGDRWLGRRGAAAWRARLPFMLGALACAQSLYPGRAVFFTLSPADACHAVYNTSPFPESPMIARLVAENTRPEERIAIIGSEPQICFLARRRSSTGHIYSLPMLQDQPFARNMQATMIHEIEQNPPAFLILVSLATSWEARPNSSHQVADWLAGYLNRGLQPVGLIQYFDAQPPEIVWGPEAATVPVRSEEFIAIFKRQAGGGADQSQVAARNKILMDRFNNCANDEAISRWQRALAANPNDAESHNNLGVALNASGRTDAAISEFQAAIRLDPDYFDARNNLGVVLGRQGRTAAAITNFQEAIRLRPHDGDAHCNLGVALMKQGRLDAAISELREAVHWQPDYLTAHNTLGIALATQGRIDEAIGEFQTVLQIKPDDPGAQSNLARARALKNK